MQLSYEKLQYKEQEMDFFSGHLHHKHVPNLIRTKSQLSSRYPPPAKKKQVQLFIRMVNILSKFSARLSEIAEPIRDVSKGKGTFQLGP